MKQLLLLHGAIGSKEQFINLEEMLKVSFETHSINFSGHGGKTIPGNNIVPLERGSENACIQAGVCEHKIFLTN